MRFVFFTHSLASDWNHGNAHFLRGVMSELVARGHEAIAYEPADGWSRRNLIADQGEAAVADFHRRFPELRGETYGPAPDLAAMLDRADVVLVHEWTEPDLVARLGAARRAGAPVLGAYEWQLGARTRAANAALVGLGRTRRILLSDTLLAGYSEEEIEVILAHELAHHVHGDLWRALGIDALIIAGALLAGHVALHAAVGHHGLEAVADVAGMPVLLLAAAGWSLLALPLVNGLSRTHERRADAFALDLTRNPEAFIAAMRRLGAEHLADEEPSPLVRWLFHSHPPLPERIGAAREWMHQHPRV